MVNRLGYVGDAAKALRLYAECKRQVSEETIVQDIRSCRKDYEEFAKSCEGRNLPEGYVGGIRAVCVVRQVPTSLMQIVYGGRR